MRTSRSRAVAAPRPVGRAVPDRVPGDEVRAAGREADAAHEPSGVGEAERPRVAPRRCVPEGAGRGAGVGARLRHLGGQRRGRSGRRWGGARFVGAEPQVRALAGDDRGGPGGDQQQRDHGERSHRPSVAIRHRLPTTARDGPEVRRLSTPRGISGERRARGRSESHGTDAYQPSAAPPRRGRRGPPHLQLGGGLDAVLHRSRHRPRRDPHRHGRPRRHLRQGRQRQAARPRRRRHPARRGRPRRPRRRRRQRQPPGRGRATTASTAATATTPSRAATATSGWSAARATTPSPATRAMTSPTAAAATTRSRAATTTTSLAGSSGGKDSARRRRRRGRVPRRRRRRRRQGGRRQARPVHQLRQRQGQPQRGRRGPEGA